MQTSHVGAIEHTVQRTHEWLAAVMRALETNDQHHAYQALCATLHALRDRLPSAEAVDLAAQLPTLVRGIWYDGWTPSHRPKALRSREEFLEVVRERFPNERYLPERVVRAVFGVLDSEISTGEIDQVRHVLPRHIRELWPERG